MNKDPDRYEPFEPGRPFIRFSLPSLREGWRWWVGSFVVIAGLLGGAVLLERNGLWPDSFKTARQRQQEARKQSRPQWEPGPAFTTPSRF
jgi:hypothetical protein